MKSKPISRMNRSERLHLWRTTRRYSDLLEIAVRDAMALEKTREVKFDMYAWVEAPTFYEKKCRVCLAGAQMYRDLGVLQASKISARHSAVNKMRVGYHPEIRGFAFKQAEYDVSMNEVSRATTIRNRAPLMGSELVGVLVSDMASSLIFHDVR